MRAARRRQQDQPPLTGHVASGYRQVIAGAHHSYGLRNDGQVMAWGRNYRDELGDGPKTSRSRAITVPDVTDARLVSGGEYSVALVG